jgi:hypothetical protein
MSLKTRRYCTTCRLAKCLSIGMDLKLIRKEVQQRKNCLLTTDSYNNQNVLYKQVMVRKVEYRVFLINL